MENSGTVLLMNTGPAVSIVAARKTAGNQNSDMQSYLVQADSFPMEVRRKGRDSQKSE